MCAPGQLAHGAAGFGNPIAAGGELDVDECITPCGEGPHVENLVFRDDAPRGTYEVWVENYDPREGGPFEIEVDAGGELLVFDGSLPAIFAASESFVFTL